MAGVGSRRRGRLLGLGVVLAVLAAWLPGVAHAIGWDPAISDLSASGQDASDARVGVSADGTRATAVWLRSDGSNTIVQAASATINGATATWGTPVNLSAAGQSASQPQVGVSADGTRATAVWLRSDGSNTVAQAASATINGATATWGTPVNLSAAGRNASGARVGVSADGTRATAGWLRWNGVTTAVQAASASIDGTAATWGTPSDLSATGEDGLGLEMGVSADGARAVAVWERLTMGSRVLLGVAATIDGTAATWGTPVELSAADGDAYGARVGVSADGARATAVWLRSDGSNYVVQTASATIVGTSATWGTPNDLSAAGLDAQEPEVGVSADGTRATAVWRRPNGGYDVVQAASGSIDGTTATWGSPTDLTAAGRNAYDARVGVSADGARATAVWYRSNGSNTIVQAASASIDGTTATWGTPTDLSAAGQDVDDGRVDVSADGTRATAVWQRWNGSNTIVQARSGQALVQTITFPAPVDTAVDAGPVALSATASSGLPVSFTSSTPGVCTVSGTAATLVAVGDCTVVAGQPGNADYAAAVDVARTFRVLPAAQSITFPAPPDTAVDAGPVALSATASSGLPVSFTSSTPGVCTVSGTAATLVAVGVCTVVAGQPGNADYAAAVDVARTFRVLPAAQTITFPAPPDTAVDAGPVMLSATASSGLPVSFTSSTPGVCTVSGTAATLVAAGTCTVTASQAGNATYVAAPDVTRSFTVSPGLSPPTPVRPGKPTSVKATSKAGKVTVTWVAPSGSVSGYTVQSSKNKKKWKNAGTTGPAATRFVWKKGKKGTTYYLRVAASSTAGPGPWSKPARIKVR